MSNLAIRTTRMTAYRWLILQIAVVIVASLLLLAIQGINSATSTLLGGLVCILPQWLFARRFFSFYRASAAQKMVSNLYLGESLKLLLTGALFILAIMLFQLNMLAFMFGFISAQFIFLLAPLLSVKK